MIYILAALLVPSAAMVLWAARTGTPARTPEHSLPNAQGRTERLPAIPTAEAPPLERDGGMAQRLPRPEDMPWPAHDDRPRPRRGLDG